MSDQAADGSRGEWPLRQRGRNPSAYLAGTQGKSDNGHV